MIDCWLVHLALGDLWIYDPVENSWEEKPVSGPVSKLARYKHTAVWDDVHNRMIVFGGMDASGK